ncbi:MAG TPA: hypothetical protein PK090_01210 [Smithellaceae bacterium]|nr:hypothetical protein [Smithellaceae bacterium]
MKKGVAMLLLLAWSRLRRTRRVAAHQLFFFTPGGVLNVFSALTIR